MICPCGSGKDLAQCCRLLLEGTAATTAELLMRSRYTAYVLGDSKYLRQSWHPATRPSRVRMDDVEWLSLSIVSVQKGRENDNNGVVEFVAAFRMQGRYRLLHESSRFERLGGQWFYHDGDCRIETPKRNAPCLCGSGKKFKRCCGTDTGLP